MTKDKQWYENALLLGIAGSIIAVVGQLAGTVIPIMYGPQDIEDFNINLDTASIIVDCRDPTPYRSATVNITIEDLHKWLRPYRHKIQFNAIGSINETNVLFDPPEMRLQSRFDTRKNIRSNWMHRDQYGNWAYRYNSPDTTTAYIDMKINFIPAGDYPITIQGIGSDGKIHNSTVTLRFMDQKRYFESHGEVGLIYPGKKLYG